MDRDEVFRRRQQHRRELRRLEMRKRKKRNKYIFYASAIVVFIIIIAVIISSISSCVSDDKSSDTSPTTAATTPPVTEAETSAPSDSISQVTPIEDNGQDGEFVNGVYIWNNSAFELFFGSQSSATAYADKISSYSEQLGSDYNVYNMVVPNHTEFGLPDRLQAELENNSDTLSQRDNTKAIYDKYTDNVKYIDIYNTLNEHKTEYLYFNTDHHWTGLGAYYAYSDFMKAVDKEPFNLEDATKNSVEGFVGSFFTLTQDTRLSSNPDTVDYYEFPGDYTCTIPDISLDPVNMYYDMATAGSNTYGVFIWGDNPLTVINNNTNNSGEKIVIVKESYGNAISPYFAYNYDETHIIDFRHYEGNLVDYCEENEITDVLFINGIMSANTPIQLANMDTLF